MITRILLALLVLSVWLVFLTYAPKEISGLVCVGIAGWQVGTWCARLADSILGE